MDMGTKYQLSIRVAPRYRRATKKEKTRILDEYMAITGLSNRK